MRNWKVGPLVLGLLLIVLCSGRELTEVDKLNVYAYYDEDMQVVKSLKLTEFLPFFEKLYETCDKNVETLNEIIAQYLDCLNEGVAISKNIKYTLDYLKTNFTQHYNDWISKELKMIETVENTVVTTCYKELQDWAAFEKQSCINAIKQDEQYNEVKESILYFKKEMTEFYEDYLNRKAKRNFITTQNTALGDLEFHYEHILMILQIYTEELAVMKLKSYSKNNMKKFSIDYLQAVSSNLMLEVQEKVEWLENCTRQIPRIKEGVQSCQDYCHILEDGLESSLKKLEDDEVHTAIFLIELFTNAQYFLIQNDSLVEVDCEDHVPVFSLNVNERIISSETTDGILVRHIKGEHEKNGSYERIISHIMNSSKSINVNETIIYANSEIAPLNNMYLIKIKP